MIEMQDPRIPKAYRPIVRRRQKVIEYAALYGVRSTAGLEDHRWTLKELLRYRP